MKRIVVIGSSNTDLVVRTDHIPKPGETVMGGEFLMTSGGKGANQAITVARLGGDLLFVSRLGNDLFGKELLNQYTREGINTERIRIDAEKPSGVALVSVDRKGENSIVVAPGANQTMTRQDIDAVKEDILSAGYILMQLEIPMDIVEYVAEMAACHGKKIILNPAPASSLSPGLYKSLYLITPNRTEAQQLTGLSVTGWEDAEQAADVLLQKGVRHVVITLGRMGSLIRNDTVCERVPALSVDAVDTTAAGDVFNGALCVALAEGKPLPEAVRFATKASAFSVTRMGAQTSIPFRKDLDEKDQV